MAKKTAKTTAEVVSEIMGNDGSRFNTRDGKSLDHVARHHGARVELSEDRSMSRYAFPDGSSIITAGGAWDLALSPKCWCWDGEGHSEACRERQTEVRS